MILTMLHRAEHRLPIRPGRLVIRFPRKDVPTQVRRWTPGRDELAGLGPDSGSK